MKVVIISGLARGGTNILWNAIQSHPEYCSAMLETNEILRNTHYIPKYIKFIIDRYSRCPNIVRSFSRVYSRQVFLKLKEKNFEDPFNKYKTEDELYALEEIKNCGLVLKGVTSVNSFELRYSDFINQVFPESYNIRLIRNGYAVCEGWVRRGAEPRKAGIMYRRFGEKILEESTYMSRHKIIKYEDFIPNIFSITKEILDWTNASPVHFKKIRLKAKKVLSNEGRHQIRSGVDGQKYWVSQEELGAFIDFSINQKQIAQLSISDAKVFESEAKPILDKFQYTIADAVNL